MKITQYGNIGDVAEVHATRTHANGHKERFRLFLTIAPDMVMAGGTLHPGAALTARGDRMKITDFERDYIAFCVNEGGVLSASTRESVVANDPVFSFGVVRVGSYAIRSARRRRDTVGNRPQMRTKSFQLLSGACR